MIKALSLFALPLLSVAVHAYAQQPLPVIDMHLHASSPAGFGGPQTVCTNRDAVEFPPVDPDVAQNNWGFPRAHFYRQLQQLVDAGFGKRIMFGSDQMIWPDAIPIALETIEQATFLTREQKRDILYNNAARFLRLSEETISRQHGDPDR